MVLFVYLPVLLFNFLRKKEKKVRVRNSCPYIGINGQSVELEIELLDWCV